MRRRVGNGVLGTESNDEVQGTPVAPSAVPTLMLLTVAAPIVAAPDRPTVPRALRPVPRTADTPRARTTATGPPVSPSPPKSSCCCAGPGQRAAVATEGSAARRASTPSSP